MVYRKVYYRNIVFIIEIEEDWYFRFVLFFNNKFFECEIKYLNIGLSYILLCGSILRKWVIVK